MSEFRVLQPLLPCRISVVVATFGDVEWALRGLERALDTFLMQTRAPETIWYHGDTLAEARNRGAELATGSWLVFLDADDKLDPQFCDALDATAGEHDIYQTSVRGFRGDLFIEERPVFHSRRALSRSNYLVIGSPISADRFRRVGGFDEYPCLEDWALWLKAKKDGATFGECREAVYLINDDHKRNFSTEQFAVAQEIREKYS